MFNNSIYLFVDLYLYDNVNSFYMNLKQNVLKLFFKYIFIILLNYFVNNIIN